MTTSRSESPPVVPVPFALDIEPEQRLALAVLMRAADDATLLACARRSRSARRSLKRGAKGLTGPHTPSAVGEFLERLDPADRMSFGFWCQYFPAVEPAALAEGMWRRAEAVASGWIGAPAAAIISVIACEDTATGGR